MTPREANRAARAAAIDAMTATLDLCEREGRNMSRSERAAYRKNENEVEQLDAEHREAERQILAAREAFGAHIGTSYDFEPRMSQGGPESRPFGYGDVLGSGVLTREQTLVDWARFNGRGESFYGSEPFRLGALIRARVTGDSRDLTETERRALAEGADATGGVLVPEELSSAIIDRARALSVVLQAGAVTAAMESDTLVLARLATGSTAAWKAENAAISASDQAWERVELKAKVVVVEQLMSRELFEDISPEGQRAIEHEIAQAIALKLDLAALEGSGTAPEPRGIANTTGVGSVSMGTNGLKPTNHDPLVNAVYAVLKANGAAPTAAVLHPRDLETFALLKDTTGQPLRPPAALDGLPMLSSSQLSTARTQGTSTDASNAYVGDFSQVIIGVRPSLQLRFQVLQERFSDNLQVGLLAWLRADVALAHPEHLTKIVGLRIV